MRRALIAMLKAPLERRHDANYGEGWRDHSKNFHALTVIRHLHERGLVLPPTRLAVLSIAGRREAQGIRSENTTRPECRNEGDSDAHTDQTHG
jgi:hypothetical protein